MSYKMDALISIVLSLLILQTYLPVVIASPLPKPTKDNMVLEHAISRRSSIRTWKTTDIPVVELSKVLWAANGYSQKNEAERTSISLDGVHSIVVFVVNRTATYRYIPKTHSLVLWKATTIIDMINRECWTGTNNYNGGASAILLFVWNQTVSGHQIFNYFKIGSMIQNVYLLANSLGLGTVAQSVINRENIRSVLELSSDYEPVVTMPLGYVKYNYPAAGPYTDVMTNNLPKVVYSDVTLDVAMDEILSVTTWSTDNLSIRELSQLLWAAYGYTNVSSSGKIHRTVPSAYGAYPMKIYTLNASGVYLYEPETHSLSLTINGDKRFEVASSAGGAIWAASAPVMFIIVYNSDLRYPISDPTFLAYIEAGLISQELYLEARAWSIGTTAIGTGLEEYNGAGASAIRNILDLPQSEVPLYIQLVGHLPTLRNHVIEYEGSVFHVLTSSNSSISNLIFNQSLKEISLHVMGPDSPSGYCNVTIPKELLSGTFTVTFDDTLIIPTLTQSSTHTFIYIEYTPSITSIHIIQIRGTEVIPEFPLIIMLPIVLVVLGGLLTSIRRRLKHEVDQSAWAKYWIRCLL